MQEKVGNEIEKSVELARSVVADGGLLSVDAHRQIAEALIFTAERGLKADEVVAIAQKAVDLTWEYLKYPSMAGRYDRMRDALTRLDMALAGFASSLISTSGREV